MPADQSSPSPDQPSPARLFATLAGVVLVIGGTLGFFHASTFGTPGEIEDALGFAVNGWINTLHIVVGALGLLAAGFAARTYSLATALLFGAMAIWGFALGSDEALLDRFPADEAENLLHAAIAMLGLSAWLAERPGRKPRKGDEERAAKRTADKKARTEDKRERKRRREERRKREEQRREERRKREEAEKAEKDAKDGKDGKTEKAGEPASGPRSAGESRSRQTAAGDGSAGPGDEPRTPPERPSQRRRRRRRPQA